MIDIFKAYDIRGVYPDELNEAAAEAAARAFCRLVKPAVIVVGSDARLSSPFLKSAVIRGIAGEGVSVLDIGVSPAPLVGFAMRALKAPAGVMVSASHSPPQYNGLKLQRRTDQGFILQVGWGAGMEQVAAAAEEILKSSGRPHFRQGQIVKYDPLPEYINYLSREFSAIGGLTLAADYANGVGGVSAVPVFKALKIRADNLFAEPDGRFPEHLADPDEPENLKALRRYVVKNKLDLGLAFDGDADRVFAIDENGQVIEPDIILGICATHELKKTPLADRRVYHDLRASRAVVENIRLAGGEPIVMPVGNALIKRRLVERGGMMAGENSGHLMFPRNGAVDDGLYTALSLMKVMALRVKPLSALAKPFRKYARLPEFSVLRNGGKEALFSKIGRAFPEARASRFDGLSLKTPDWWLNIRPSNTEPVMRINLEAGSQRALAATAKKIKKLL